MAELHLHPNTTLIDAHELAASLGYRLYSDRRGQIQMRPVASNAGRIKIPRNKLQYFRVFGRVGGKS